MNGLRETCHCSHDSASHYRDPSTGVRHSCLCTGCACTAYVNESDPPPKPKLKRPKHADYCRCYRCEEYLQSIGASREIPDDNGPDTEPYLPLPRFWP